jgi:hypothetical protein
VPHLVGTVKARSLDMITGGVCPAAAYTQPGRLQSPPGGTYRRHPAATTVGARDAFSPYERGQTPCATWEPHKVFVPIGLPRVELRCRVVRQGVVKLPER